MNTPGKIPPEAGPDVGNPSLQSLAVPVNLAPRVQVDVRPVLDQFVHRGAVGPLADVDIGLDPASLVLSSNTLLDQLE